MPGPLLRPGETVEVRPSTEPFFAQDHFVLNLESRDQILISLIGADFLKWFQQKREIPAGPATLRSYELQDNAGDVSIVAALGGEQKAETTLAQVFWLLERQKRGERGALANNGWGNIFYIRDVDGALRSVYVHWCDDAWNVEAVRIGRAAEWPIRDRAFAPA